MSASRRKIACDVANLHNEGTTNALTHYLFFYTFFLNRIFLMPVLVALCIVVADKCDEDSSNCVIQTFGWLPKWPKVQVPMSESLFY